MPTALLIVGLVAAGAAAAIVIPTANGIRTDVRQDVAGLRADIRVEVAQIRASVENLVRENGEINKNIAILSLSHEFLERRIKDIAAAGSALAGQ